MQLALEHPTHTNATLREAEHLRGELLGGRAQVPLNLAEVSTVGRVIFDDPDHLNLYGLAPSTLDSRGLQIAGRTAIECVVDVHARALAEATARALGPDHRGPIAVFDLFMGSGNLLFHVAQKLGAVQATGIERDEVVCRLTRENFTRLSFPATVLLGEYRKLFSPAMAERDQTCVVLIAPPWGDGFSFTNGLDLRKTKPPVGAVLDDVRAVLPNHRVIALIQTHEKLVEESVLEVTRGRKVLGRGVAGGSPAGRNVGYLLCEP